AGPAPCAGCVGRMHRARPGPIPPGLDASRSLLAYEGPARELVTRLKYRNDRAAMAWLADGMASLVDPPAGAVVTWAPTTTRRRRDRGFDQAELLAAAVARRWGLPRVRLLVRRPGPPQTGRTVTDRRLGPAMAATPAAAALLGTTRRVVVVDDVVTTGSTLGAAALVLRSVGALWVAGLTAARTPRR
ncbi:MAG: ComF family protein, partial [Acidimicrobiales bacterium]